MEVFTELSIIITIGTLIALIMRALRQPLIIGHIITGILVGPAVLGIIQSQDTLGVLGKFGIALLLFVVGLGLNPRIVKELGKVSLITGVGQVLFTSLAGYFIVRALGFDSTSAVYLSIALAFSSTIVIVKLLSDKKEQNKLYGRISIGFLLVQDILATFALVFAAASSGGGQLSYSEFATLAIKGIGLAVLVYFVAQTIIGKMTHFLGRSQELLFLVALTWGFGVGTLFYKAGFSLEVGALLAGIALANMPYAVEISSRLRPLRDFFIVLFFVTLGAGLQISGVGEILPQAIILSIFVLIGNPLIVLVMMGLLGYTKKTSFKTSLAVAQISEFSIIFVLLGKENGQLSEQVVAVTTVVALITFAVSSYFIIYSDAIYTMLENYLSMFERKHTKGAYEPKNSFDAILFGYKKGGQEFAKVFKNLTSHYVVIDYDPEVIEELETKRIPYIYGDATDPELLQEIDLSSARMVVSHLSDHSSNEFILRYVEQHNTNTVVMCYAEGAEEAAELYGLGASYVMMPHYIGSQKISSFIRKNKFKKGEYRKFREKHIEYLQRHFEEMELVKE